MSDERVTVGTESESEKPISMPVVQLLTGRGFITGKSGSGKSNTASVVVEELLEAGYPVLIVDTDGEYYGLKEEYELLHAGADEECDIQVGPEHAEKVAELALEGNVPPRSRSYRSGWRVGIARRTNSRRPPRPEAMSKRRTNPTSTPRPRGSPPRSRPRAGGRSVARPRRGP